MRKRGAGAGENAGPERLLKAQQAQKVLGLLEAALTPAKTADHKKGIKHLHNLIDAEVKAALKELNGGAKLQPGEKGNLNRGS